MEIRKLTAEERFDAALISHIAFHMKMEDPEKVKAQCANDKEDEWGAFDPSGRLMAHMINHHFESCLDGVPISNGGIGGVSTLPEYRETGAVRAIFSSLLPDAYRSGEVISTLFPFSHTFYRKFGYETVCAKNVYSFSPSVLRDYRFSGAVRQWQPGDSIAPYLRLGNLFAGQYNLSFYRSEARLREEHFGGLYFKDRKFAYLLGEEQRPSAYVIFRDVYHDPAAILQVEDIAWTAPEGFRAILGFLARFSADYGTIELPLPYGMELYALIHSPDSYDIVKRTEQCYMVRAVNAQRLLKAMRKPPQARFTLQVTDELIPENEGIWTVTGEDVKPSGGRPDLSLDIRTLGQLAVGAISLSEAEYRDDVTIHGNHSTLSSVFVRKPLMVQAHF